MRCYEKKNKMYYETYNESPLWGNIDIFIYNKAHIYIKLIMINQYNIYKLMI